MNDFACWLQARLLAAGHDPGPLDCDPGRLTYAALRAFQRDRDLPVTGVADARTVAALRGIDGDFRAAGAREDALVPWYDEARRLLGTREVPGRGANPVIIDWADGLAAAGKPAAIDYTDDDIPWCGLFAAHCIASVLPDERLPRNYLGARNWLRLGVDTAPRKGAVLVFWRGSRAGWQGHVGFYHAEDRTAFHVLGGNQTNAVTITRISKTRLLGARWPATAATLRTKPRLVAADGQTLSSNEA